MSTPQRPAPDYQWAIHSDPDYLVLQFPPIPVTHGAGSVDAMRALFRARGFTPVASQSDQRPPAAKRCALTKVDETSAELVVQVGGAATRIAVPHAQPAWAERVFADGEVLVLVSESAIEDGVIALGHLERDVDAGGVLAARVPAGRL